VWIRTRTYERLVDMVVSAAPYISQLSRRRILLPLLRIYFITEFGPDRVEDLNILFVVSLSGHQLTAAATLSYCTCDKQFETYQTNQLLTFFVLTYATFCT
jgi:hypothetical protein